MNKVYFIAPLAALLVFIGVYSVHRGELKTREAEKAAATLAMQKAKLETEQAERRAAMAEAIKAAEQRKIEKAAKEAREQAQKEARQLAVDARDKAYREQEKSARQIERLEKEIEVEQAALAKLAAEHRTTESEKAFLQEFVVKAQTNVQALQTLLAKLNAPAPAPAPAAR
jgi:chromosome segregation ATPase